MRFMIAALLCAVPSCVTQDARKSSAERNARSYAEESRLAIEGVTCVSIDADNNGMVGCTLHLPDQHKRQLECATDVALPFLGQPSGCKDVVYGAIGTSQNN